MAKRKTVIDVEEEPCNLVCNGYLQQICEHLKDSFYRVRTTLNNGADPLAYLSERQEWMAEKYEARVSAMREHLENNSPHLLKALEERPEYASCGEHMGAASLVTVVFDEFQKIKPKDKEELKQKIDGAYGRYRNFFFG